MREGRGGAGRGGLEACSNVLSIPASSTQVRLHARDVKFALVTPAVWRTVTLE